MDPEGFGTARSRGVTPGERRIGLEEIATEVRGCTRCRLHESRTLAVPGEGHPETEVVFVGEGPGFNEDQQGRPFVGAAGGLLTELIRSVGWSREEVFITNIVKCRPPGNRDPQPDEVAACRPYLQRQLSLLDPAVVVTLGRHSLDTFQPGARIGAAHGTARPVDPDTGAPAAMTFAMYHPAAAFRQGSLRATLQEDMLSIPEVLVEARARRGRQTAAPEQPSVAVHSAPAAPPTPAGIAAAPVPMPVPTAVPVEPERVAVSIQPAPSLLAADEPSPDQLSLF